MVQQTDMERINNILKLDTYQSYIEKNHLAEKERRFCRHDMAHFLDVARIAMILNESEKYGIPKELIYAAALLHDVGRWKQYQDGTPHEIAGAALASEILQQCRFDKEEEGIIVTAIRNHRNEDVREEKDLKGLLYRADKLSRACFFCPMEQECKWKQDRKNKELFL